MRIDKEMARTVTFIGTQSEEFGATKTSWQATAFFVVVKFRDHPRYAHAYLVTAKHVVVAKGNSPKVVRINRRDGTSTIVPLNDSTSWFMHPEDHAIDIAVTPVSLGIDLYDFACIPIDLFITNDLIQEKNIGFGDEIAIVGLFVDVAGRSRSLPIVRTGNIALIPNEPIPTELLGDIDAYLIEARSTGGLSGSPVFLTRLVDEKYYFLGLIHGHWRIPAPQRTNLEDNMLDNYSEINRGIAIVIPATKLIEVLNQPALVIERGRIEEELAQEHT